MSEPPKTDGERMVWAAAYAASFVALRVDARRLCLDDIQHLPAVASQAADEAWGALDELRGLASRDGDFQADAAAVIGRPSSGDDD